MFKNYLHTAWRNLKKNKLYAFINILGLSLGLISFIFIALFVMDEWSYDSYHSKSDRIYRLWQTIEMEGQGERSSSLQFPVAPNLKNDYPHLIEHAVRFFDMQQEEHLLSRDDKRFNTPDVFFVDTTVFEVFDWELLDGDIDKALASPNQVVITPEVAEMLFGDEDPIGKEIKMEANLPLMVSGILKPIPHNSHLHINALVSFPTLRAFMGNPVQANNWVWNPCWTYVEMKEDASIAELEGQFPHFVEKYYPPFMAKQVNFFLMPIEDIHLKSQLEYEIEPNGNADTVWILGLIGLFILLIAAINFVNLATARSAQRAKEVGIRKVLGGVRSQLIYQFLGESVLYAILALIFSLAAIEVLTPVFNDMADRHFDHFMLYRADVLLPIIGIAVLTGLLSGLYPAFYLSSFEPVKSLKSGYSGARGSKWFRRALMVIQFCIALGLMVGTLVVSNQFHYLLSKDTGFNQSGVVVIRNKPSITQQFDSWRAELLKHPEIEEVTRMNEVMGVDHNVHEYRYEGMQSDEWKYFPSLIVDEYFINTFDLEVIAGRAFNPDIKSDDTSAVVVNETMIASLGWTPEEAVGQQFITPHGNERIIGVVKDFHFVDFTEEIQPFVLDMQKSGNFGLFFNKYSAVRISGNHVQSSLDHMEDKWSSLNPEFPFEYFFLDGRMARQYRSQAVLKNLVMLFSVLAILITCIGLFALSSFTIERRTREVGVRKVLGAPDWSLAAMLFKDQLILLVVASVIALPVSFYFLNDWLSTFAYRSDISILVFPGAMAIVLLISALTVSYHAMRITRTDPVKALRVQG